MKIKEKQFNIIVGILCFLFFLIYSYTVLKVHLPNYLEFKHLIFNWPDANANYFFSSIFAKFNSFSFDEPLNIITDNLIHTRSMNVFNSNLVPISFLPSVLIFGLFFKVLGSIGILFLTPLLAALTGYIIYRLSYLIFKDLELSFLISLFLLSLGPWLFFANMVMLPTILFIFLLSLGFLLYRKNYILGSSLISLAIIVRPTEIVWILALILIIAIYNRSRINIKKSIVSFIIFLLFFSLFLYLNKITYGNYFTLGYFNLQNNTLPTEFSDSSSNYFKMIFIPFGFYPFLILKNFFNYFVNILQYSLLPILFSFIFLLFKLKVNKKFKERRIWKYYLISLITIFSIILIYYGSWDIVDPLVKELNTISISYVRYFLPLFILILPLTALFFNIITFNNKGFNKICRMIILYLVFIIPSFSLAFLPTNDGLFKNHENLLEYYDQFRQVKEIVPKDSVIISERSDKVFFPYYKTITFQDIEGFWDRVDNINDREVYYYTDKNTDMKYIEINNFKLIKIK